MGVNILGFLKGRLRPGRQPRPVDLASALERRGLTFARWWQRRAGARRLYADVPDAAVSALHTDFPELTAATIRAAEQLLEHRFDLLGSGPFTPHDPDRPVRADGYRPIDWYLDPVQGLRFPAGVPHKQWNLMQMRPGNADVKLPWELARCQHWPTLAQAYRLSGRAEFALEIIRQASDFMEANPVGLGIHWTCTMDVAIRALNWASALEMIRTCPAIDAATWQAAYTALFAHGVFIISNLENCYEVTSNHYLSNVVGLYYLAAAFDEVAEAEEWDAYCREAFEREIGVQVLPDGADFESSVPYHRLVTELFLGAARLADFRGQPLSRSYLARLGTMVDYLVGVQRPDGLMPQVGDADDGRLHIFTRYANWQRQDARHVLAPASHVLDRPEWRALAGDEGAWEAAWWGYESEKKMAPEGAVSTFARLYPDAGLAVVRDAGTYLLITNSIVGTKGFGNHKHNDQLNFEFHARGVPLVVDPGSYVYTSDPAARNVFRGTGYHNTLCVDDTEQNEVNPEWLFRMMEAARAEHLAFTAEGGRVEYRGRHHGYERLPEPVTHERTFRLELAAGTLEIEDVLSGSGQHRCRWHFHLAPNVEAAQVDPETVDLRSGEVRYRLHLPAGLTATLGSGWYSPSYGVRQPCQVIDLEVQVELRGQKRWSFVVAPVADGHVVSGRRLSE